MVVVEGVARGLDPNINIWQVAKPVVEDYIARNLGPVALLRDLGRTAQVLARFGPRLPKLMEDLLIRQAELQKPLPLRRTVPRIWVAGVAVLMALAAFWLGRTL
jgi:ubiquinone biosynthesis protein